MTDQSITLGADGRAALRNAIRAGEDRSVPGYRDPKHAGKNELLARAKALGLDVAAIIAGAPALNHAPASQADDVDAGDTPDAVLPVVSRTPAEQALSILAMPVMEARTAIEELAAQAAKPPTVVEKIVERIVQAEGSTLAALTVPGHGSQAPAFTPSVVDQKSAAELFGFDPKDRTVPLTLRETMLDVWNDPTSPAVDPAYRFDLDILADVVAAHEGGVLVWSAGPAGTGKSTFWEQFAARQGRGFTQIVCDKTLSRLELFGGKELANGSTYWKHGVLTLAITRPGMVVLLDEPSAARPGELIALHGLLVPGGRLTLETGEVVFPAEGVYFAAADNTAGRGDETGQYIDTGPMNAAFVNRWGVTVQFEYLPVEEEANILAKRVPGLPLSVALMLAEVAATARAGVVAGNISIAPSIRNLIAWASLLVAKRPVMRAAQVTMLSTLNSVDREAMHQIVLLKVNEADVNDALSGKATKAAKTSDPADGNPF